MVPEGRLKIMFKKEKNVRPFEGIKIIDITHVLAGPFAAYQLALLGADVIKVEDPHECDQSREGGSDQDLADKKMGLQFMTQASNKRSITGVSLR